MKKALFIARVFCIQPHPSNYFSFQGDKHGLATLLHCRCVKKVVVSTNRPLFHRTFADPPEANMPFPDFCQVVSDFGPVDGDCMRRRERQRELFATLKKRIGRLKCQSGPGMIFQRSRDPKSAWLTRRLCGKEVGLCCGNFKAFQGTNIPSQDPACFPCTPLDPSSQLRIMHDGHGLNPRNRGWLLLG